MSDMLDQLFEKRQLKRRHLIYYLRVFNNQNNQLIGHLVDITSKGIMLISENPVNTGVDYEMRMTLPAEILAKSDILLKGTCLWCKKDINPDFYASGFNVQELPVNDILVIESLIQRYGFQD